MMPFTSASTDSNALMTRWFSIEHALRLGCWSPPFGTALSSDGSVGETHEHDEGTVDAHKIGRRQAAKMITEVGPWHRGDLVDHHSTRLLEAGDGGRIHIDSSQRSIDRIGRQGADGHRCGGVETVILHDDNRTRLAGARATGGGGVDI